MKFTKYELNKKILDIEGNIYDLQAAATTEEGKKAIEKILTQIEIVRTSENIKD